MSCDVICISVHIKGFSSTSCNLTAGTENTVHAGCYKFPGATAICTSLSRCFLEVVKQFLDVFLPPHLGSACHSDMLLFQHPSSRYYDTFKQLFYHVIFSFLFIFLFILELQQSTQASLSLFFFPFSACLSPV